MKLERQYYVVFKASKFGVLMGKKGPSPNDQRSNALNPNNSANKANMDHHSQQSNPGSEAHKAATDNRSNQMNPNNSSFDKSRGKK
jgi:hypothetical protein